MKYVALGLALAYLIAYIAIGIYYVIPMLSVPIEAILAFNLWQIIGTCLYFTAGMAGLAYSIIGIITIAVWHKDM